MAAITRFEDIVAWQEARKLTRHVYGVTGREPFARDFSMRDQIQRASVSSMSNIAEGFDCESKAEFGRPRHRTAIHRGSAINSPRRPGLELS